MSQIKVTSRLHPRVISRKVISPVRAVTSNDRVAISPVRVVINHVISSARAAISNVRAVINHVISNATNNLRQLESLMPMPKALI